MSKPIARIVFSALIVLALVAGIYFSVQAASSKASLNGERIVTTAGLLPDIKHFRASANDLKSYEGQTDYFQPEHDCLSSPDD